jgi:hypothetical protein
MKEFPAVTAIQVGLDFGSGRAPLGRLVLREGRIYFAYEPSFLTSGLEISPFMLPCKSEVMTFDTRLFEGLPGVFNDSLPDGWGGCYLTDMHYREGEDLPKLRFWIGWPLLVVTDLELWCTSRSTSQSMRGSVLISIALL